MDFRYIKVEVDGSTTADDMTRIRMMVEVDGVQHRVDRAVANDAFTSYFERVVDEIKLEIAARIKTHRKIRSQFP